jgi:hypothetical protein
MPRSSILSTASPSRTTREILQYPFLDVRVGDRLQPAARLPDFQRLIIMFSATMPRR